MEDAFERRLSELASPDAAAAEPEAMAATERTDPGQAKGIDKSILAVAAPRRYRNRGNLPYVAQQACLLCGLRPHLGFTQPRVLGRKVGDEFAVPPLSRASSRRPSLTRRDRVVAAGRH